MDGRTADDHHPCPEKVLPPDFPQHVRGDGLQPADAQRASDPGQTVDAWFQLGQRCVDFDAVAFEFEFGFLGFRRSRAQRGHPLFAGVAVLPVADEILPVLDRLPCDGAGQRLAPLR